MRIWFGGFRRSALVIREIVDRAGSDVDPVGVGTGVRVASTAIVLKPDTSAGGGAS
jgi:hypothetical protein